MKRETHKNYIKDEVTDALPVSNIYTTMKNMHSIEQLIFINKHGSNMFACYFFTENGESKNLSYEVLHEGITKMQ